MNTGVLKICIYSAIIIWFFVGGRLFCGKMCPIGYLQDFIYKIPSPVKITTFKGDKYLRLIKYGDIILDLIQIFAMIFSVSYVLEQIGSKIPSVIGIIINIGIFIICFILRRPFCKYFCKIGAVSSLFNKISLYKYKANVDKCIKCGACSKICKMNIIPYEIKNDLECIRCGLCKKVCPKDVIISGINIKKY
ncbi:MAG: 4Fe-4S binding protein [Fusobacteriaceae bacterium]|jgi:polyferredoxin|nr:4Fe-4S binding protein [Fusobacteriaceae bacterium]